MFADGDVARVEAQLSLLRLTELLHTARICIRWVILAPAPSPTRWVSLAPAPSPIHWVTLSPTPIIKVALLVGYLDDFDRAIGFCLSRMLNQHRSPHKPFTPFTTSIRTGR